MAEGPIINATASLFTGAPGPKGDDGDVGPVGATGATGPQGPTGATGPAGADGAQGPQGVQGEAGLLGPQGLPGADGADSVVPGPTGPQGLPGADGATGPAGTTTFAGLTDNPTDNAALETALNGKAASVHTHAISDVVGLQADLDAKADEVQITTGLTASVTKTQGQGVIPGTSLSIVAEVAICANANDTVTLPAAVAGRTIFLLNNGAETLQVFPASGEDLGSGLNTATTIGAGSSSTFVCAVAGEWEELSAAAGGGVSYAAGGGTANYLQVPDSGGDLIDSDLFMTPQGLNFEMGSGSFAGRIAIGRYPGGMYYSTAAGTKHCFLIGSGVANIFAGGLKLGNSAAANPVRKLDVEDDSGNPQQRWSYDGTTFVDARCTVNSSLEFIVTDSSTANLVFGGGSTSGERNILLGHLAGEDITSGENNVFLGNQAGANTTTGTQNFFAGVQAGLNNTSGLNNVFIGRGSGLGSTGSEDNICIGRSAGHSIASSDQNIFLGYQAGYDNATGFNNIFIGYRTGFSHATNHYNIFIGSMAGLNHTSGANNLFLGEKTGYLNLTGVGNVFLGHQAGYNETGSDKLYISNSDTTTPLIYGDFSAEELTVNGSLKITGSFGAFDTTPVAQQAHITDADGTVGGNQTAINAILTALENYGLLASV